MNYSTLCLLKQNIFDIKFWFDKKNHTCLNSTTAHMIYTYKHRTLQSSTLIVPFNACYYLEKCSAMTM